MKDYPTDQSDEFLVELFAILMKGAEIAFEGKVPRYHQMICLWLNVHSSKTILEVKTGEGKTMIAALTALYFALRGKKVDIFTSSAALAMTETQPDSSVSKLFALFKISLGDVCLDRTVNPHLAY
jgi:preprotein translocase subunit SecA